MAIIVIFMVIVIILSPVVFVVILGVVVVPSEFIDAVVHEVSQAIQATIHGGVEDMIEPPCQWIAQNA